MSQDAFLASGLDAYVTAAMAQWAVPGMAISVVKDDELDLVRAYGFRNVEKETPVNSRSLFAIGSTSKAFTAAALAILVDEGKLDWGDPVINYLPDFQMFDPWVTRAITVRDTLTHQSGLARYDATWYGTDRDRDEILRRVRFMEPSWSFRTKAAYQNIMYLAAGQIIPAITGQSWDDYVQERIFKPLGMTASNTSITALEGQENIATPYAEIGREVRPIPWRNIDNMAPAGSINSNVVEMAQWLRLQLGGGAYAGEQILSANAVKEMHTPQFLIYNWDEIAPLREMLAPLINFWTYGLGWVVCDYRGHKVSLHQGGIDGMSSFVGLFPKENLGVTVLSNLNGSLLPLPLMLRIFDAYLDAPEYDWCAEMLPARMAEAAGQEAQDKEMEDARAEGTSPSLPLGEYAGTYENKVYGQATITQEKGKLVASCGAALTGDLEHWHYDTFRAIWRDSAQNKAYITFNLDKMGQAYMFKIDPLMDGSSALYERLANQEPPASPAQHDNGV